MPNDIGESRRALRGIALFEAIKGLAVLAGSAGLLSLLHHDARHLVHELIAHLGMNPGGHYPMVLLHYADLLENANLRLLMLAALAYATLRLIEAYGLWNDLAWGEWVGALSGGLYIPFEIRHMIRNPSAVGGLVLMANVCIVGYLLIQLYRRRNAVSQSRS